MNPGPKNGLLWRATLRRRPLLAALKVSAVVGTALNLVNNGEQLWLDHMVSPWNIALNYLVPFCVSSYSAARNEVQSKPGD